MTKDERMEIERMQRERMDAVYVTRCKNCKYGQPLDTTKAPFKYYKDSCVMCTCEDVVGEEPMIYLPDHFCSYGKWE